MPIESSTSSFSSEQLIPAVIIKGVTVLATFVSVHTTGGYYCSFNSFPEWANRTFANDTDSVK